MTNFIFSLMFPFTLLKSTTLKSKKYASKSHASYGSAVDYNWDLGQDEPRSTRKALGN